MALYLDILTPVHVALSIAGIAAGFVVLFGMLTARRQETWTRFFLVTTALTSATGFLFPVNKILPSHVLAILSLVALGIAFAARYRKQLAGPWRATYVLSAALAQYLNVFVLVVQAFRKVPALHALAPTQTEAPFWVTQVVVLSILAVWTVAATTRFHPAGLQPVQVPAGS